ncbi:MAG: hypothetical protein MJ252_26175 [archaeon]|nr:hypothetical protein [archaeon]
MKLRPTRKPKQSDDDEIDMLPEPSGRKSSRKKSGVERERQNSFDVRYYFNLIKNSLYSNENDQASKHKLRNAV